MDFHLCCWSFGFVFFVLLFIIRSIRKTQWGRNHPAVVDTGEKVMLDLIGTLKDKGKSEDQLKEESGEDK